jgi:hypothetical protein
VQIGQLFFLNFFFSRAGPRSVPDRAAQLQQQRRAEEERAARARERAQALLKVLSCCFLLQRCFTAAFTARERAQALLKVLYCCFLLLLYYCFTTALLLLYYCFTTALLLQRPRRCSRRERAQSACVSYMYLKIHRKKKVALKARATRSDSLPPL